MKERYKKKDTEIQTDKEAVREREKNCKEGYFFFLSFYKHHPFTCINSMESTKVQSMINENRKDKASMKHFLIEPQ